MNSWNMYKNYNIPRKILQKNDDSKIEHSHPYKAKIVTIIPKYRISGKNDSQFLLGNMIPIIQKFGSEEYIYINMITVKSAITPFILIALVACIEIGNSVKNNASYLPYLT